MPRIVGLSLAALFLFMAFFKAWSEQKSQRGAISEQVQTLRAKLDSLTKSNINGSVDWAVIGSQPQDHSHVGLIVTLTNSGAASAIDPRSWRLTVVAPDEHTYSGEPNTLLNKNLDFCFPPRKVMRFVRSDALYLKGAAGLSMNGVTQGFIWFGLGASRSSISSPETLFVLESASVTGQRIAISTTIGELTRKSQETTFFSGIENSRALDVPCQANIPY
jgi:hypothetical protein